ncbi:MAG: hypothetical protein A3I01_15365 [Betaproteobacteria bacterium RIFCSPLOWO2_02_FULL_65_24]|nr:MAG: hypothetical protein A3I01_15365 [Betaproteobacteria bacterium RIFCSPLOWO2_02_FULL_65_24]
MAEKREQRAGVEIERLLAAGGWLLQSVGEANIHVSQGLASQDFPLKGGHGFANYMLYVDGKAAGVIEAKKQGHTLTGVEIQSDKYVKDLPDALPAWRRPLPFLYEATGGEVAKSLNFADNGASDRERLSSVRCRRLEPKHERF